MKKKIFLKLLFFPIILFYNGLASVQGLVISGGYNMSYLNDIYLNDYGGHARSNRSVRHGYSFGLDLPIKLSSIFDVSVGGFIETRGENSSVFTGSGYEDISLNLYYLQVPVLGKLKLSTGSTQFDFLVGPDFGFNLSASLDSEDESTKLTDIKFFDPGISFGFELAAPVNNFKIITRTLYFLAFNDAISESTYTKNRSFKFQLGLYIPISTK